MSALLLAFLALQVHADAGRRSGPRAPREETRGSRVEGQNGDGLHAIGELELPLEGAMPAFDLSGDGGLDPGMAAARIAPSAGPALERTATPREISAETMASLREIAKSVSPERGGLFGRLFFDRAAELPPSAKDFDADMTALAADLSSASRRQLGKAARELRKPAGAPILQELWRRFGASLEKPGEGESPELVLKRWSEGSERNLRERMPTLWKVLARKDKLPEFLALLSLDRLVQPYDRDNESPLTPIAQARKEGTELRLNELRIVTGSRSFRRHILYVEDEKGRFAVELKIPGERLGKLQVENEHFYLADEMWKAYGKDAGIVRPVYLGKLAGLFNLYGVLRRFTARDPLTFVIFEYEDGNRLDHSAPLVEKIAERKGVPAEEVKVGILADAATWLIRLRLLGWTLSSALGNDAHRGNVRVLADGGSVSPADLGSARRIDVRLAERLDLFRPLLPWLMAFFTSLAPGAAAFAAGVIMRKLFGGLGVYLAWPWEALMMLGVWDKKTREKMLPLVLENLRRGVSDPKRREELERIARSALHLPR